jgi:hypothetical protein
MIRCTSFLLLAVLAAPALAQERKPADSKLPTACEIRAYYLDKDGKPTAASDVKAALIFETKDGKTKSYPMTWTEAKEKDTEAPICRHFPIEGTTYRMAVGTFCTHASAPGGNSAYDKPFLKPIDVPITPEPNIDPDKRDKALTGAGYFRAYLNEQTISELAEVPYTDASIQFTIRGEGKKTRCFTCEGGVPTSPCARVHEDLNVLERQLQANELENAKVTMARIRSNVIAVPETKTNEAARKDTAACCKELDSAVMSGKTGKALAELQKLREKCDKCYEPSEKDSKKK